MRAFSFKFIQFVVEKHYKKILGSGKKKFYKLHSAINNTEQWKVWEANNAQAAALEFVVLGGAKRIHGCSSMTCN